MTRRTLKLLAYTPAAVVVAMLAYPIAVLRYPELASSFFAAVLAVNAAVFGVVGVFVHHALRRGPGSRGRRAGWVAFMLVAPILALPTYYNDVVCRISDGETVEVVVSRTRAASDDSGSIQLSGDTMSES